MKNKILALGILSLGLAAAPVAGLVYGHEGYEHCDKNHEERGAHRLERMTEKLNLSADQQTKVKAIFAEQGDKFRSLKSDTDSKVTAVLNADQKVQYAKLQEERKAKREKWKSK